MEFFHLRKLLKDWLFLIFFNEALCWLHVRDLLLKSWFSHYFNSFSERHFKRKDLLFGGGSSHFQSWVSQRYIVFIFGGFVITRRFVCIWQFLLACSIRQCSLLYFLLLFFQSIQLCSHWFHPTWRIRLRFCFLFVKTCDTSFVFAGVCFLCLIFIVTAYINFDIFNEI